MNWYVKEFSVLTKVSVPTLHHYDAIGLLKPSVRQTNGYRVYSEGDLLKLQRIIALKFFGFDLKKIKVLVGSDEDVADHLKAQESFLSEQVKQLHQAQQVLTTIVSEVNIHKTVDWVKVASLIKVYQMTKELRDGWAGKVYTEKQIEQIAEMDIRYPEEERKAFQELWADVFAQAKKNLDKDPVKSAIGKKLGLQYSLLMETLKEAYSVHPGLWEVMCKAHTEGKVPDEVFPKKEGDWLAKAAKAVKENLLQGKNKP